MVLAQVTGLLWREMLLGKLLQLKPMLCLRSKLCELCTCPTQTTGQPRPLKQTVQEGLVGWPIAGVLAGHLCEPCTCPTQARQESKGDLLRQLELVVGSGPWGWEQEQGPVAGPLLWGEAAPT